jgi:hypothetical protein
MFTLEETEKMPEDSLWIQKIKMATERRSWRETSVFSKNRGTNSAKWDFVAKRKMESKDSENEMKVSRDKTTSKKETTRKFSSTLVVFDFTLPSIDKGLCESNEKDEERKVSHPFYESVLHCSLSFELCCAVTDLCLVSLFWFIWFLWLLFHVSFLIFPPLTYTFTYPNTTGMIMSRHTSREIHIILLFFWKSFCFDIGFCYWLHCIPWMRVCLASCSVQLEQQCRDINGLTIMICFCMYRNVLLWTNKKAEQQKQELDQASDMNKHVCLKVYCTQGSDQTKMFRSWVALEKKEQEFEESLTRHRIEF